MVPVLAYVFFLFLLAIYRSVNNHYEQISQQLDEIEEACKSSPPSPTEVKLRDAISGEVVIFRNGRALYESQPNHPSLN